MSGGNPSGDGIVNLEKFVFGLNPALDSRVGGNDSGADGDAPIPSSGTGSGCLTAVASGAGIRKRDTLKG